MDIKNTLTLEMNKIYLGNCLDLLKEIPDKFVDLVVTDPPYSVLDVAWDTFNNKTDYVEFTRTWFNEIKRVLKDNSSMYCFWSEKHIRIGLDVFSPDRLLIWHHPNLAKPTKKMFLWTYDFILFKKFGKPTFTPSFVGKQNVDVFTYAKPQSNFKKDKRYHPTSKPEKLIENFISISSKEGDVVLDPFVGAGTTAVCCKRLGRNFIAFEKEEKYVNIANERLNNESSLFNIGG